MIRQDCSRRIHGTEKHSKARDGHGIGGSSIWYIYIYIYKYIYLFVFIYIIYMIWYLCSCSAKHNNYDRRSWIPWKKHLEEDVFTTTLNRGRGSCAGDLSGHIWEHTMGGFSITGMGLLLVLFLFLDLPHTFHLTYSQIFGDGRHFKQPRWQKKVQKEGCWEIVLPLPQT